MVLGTLLRPDYKPVVELTAAGHDLSTWEPEGPQGDSIHTSRWHWHCVVVFPHLLAHVIPTN